MRVHFFLVSRESTQYLNPLYITKNIRIMYSQYHILAEFLSIILIISSVPLTNFQNLHNEQIIHTSTIFHLNYLKAMPSCISFLCLFTISKSPRSNSANVLFVINCLPAPIVAYSFDKLAVLVSFSLGVSKFS